MAKVTSSSTRSTRKSTQPVRQGQDPYRANRQAVSKASVSASGKGVTPGSAGGKVTTGQGKQRVVLPELPPKPKPTYSGTTNTIRATGGNSTDAKINRLSAQTSRITGRSPVAAQPRPKSTAAANLAKSQQMLRNQLGPVASALGGLKSVGLQAVADVIAPRPTANQDMAYNQKKAADILKVKKKRST
jgi:hypothetical protein